MDFNIKVIVLAICIGIVSGMILNKVIAVFIKIIYGYEKIVFGYFQVELVTLFITAFFMIYFSLNFHLYVVLIFVWVLIILSFIDIKIKLLPDIINYPLLWLGLLLNLNQTFVPIEQAVTGAIVGYLILWSLYWLFRIICHKEGLGYGDFKLMAAVSAWLGIGAIPLLMLLSSLFGLIGCLWMWRIRENCQEPVAFGPYIAISAVIMIYLNLLGMDGISWMVPDS
ncbi:prepilin peptidase [Photorhabdus laumondii subsp. laumondii]|uniref:Prepilin peptidase n=1 Tax=Photorhabdus laumondii subsp. laumondii TaxID=141679 RepID=A0A6L9JKQ7_PHOLM|nr:MULTISPECIES: A24 family peptidase [Photorhabdus]AXG41816.1 prepilin peptidase [Photorhabdus laumondii subsp. laumondii]AXG46404.1 prepilin peptidase [Photorhabdus laumondii subsp. laumondii]MCC8383107.1 prepilin peptidase [Photorhabdus laumondii]MCC8388720.1 prepilin peptidase [Photorhabdus laumondii]MCC8413130.1 prepilin peptidase [Photorhabdus laumondii]